MNPMVRLSLVLVASHRRLTLLDLVPNMADLLGEYRQRFFSTTEKPCIVLVEDAKDASLLRSCHRRGNNTGVASTADQELELYRQIDDALYRHTGHALIRELDNLLRQLIRVLACCRHRGCHQVQYLHTVKHYSLHLFAIRDEHLQTRLPLYWNQPVINQPQFRGIEFDESDGPGQQMKLSLDLNDWDEFLNHDSQAGEEHHLPFGLLDQQQSEHIALSSSNFDNIQNISAPAPESASSEQIVRMSDIQPRVPAGTAQPQPASCSPPPAPRRRRRREDNDDDDEDDYQSPTLKRSRMDGALKKGQADKTLDSNAISNHGSGFASVSHPQEAAPSFQPDRSPRYQPPSPGTYKVMNTAPRQGSRTSTIDPSQSSTLSSISNASTTGDMRNGSAVQGCQNVTADSTRSPSYQPALSSNNNLQRQPSHQIQANHDSRLVRSNPPTSQGYLRESRRGSNRQIRAMSKLLRR